MVHSAGATFDALKAMGWSWQLQINGKTYRSTDSGQSDGKIINAKQLYTRCCNCWDVGLESKNTTDRNYIIAVSVAKLNYSSSSGAYSSVGIAASNAKYASLNTNFGQNTNTTCGTVLTNIGYQSGNTKYNTRACVFISVVI